MKVITARNVHQALPMALELLYDTGVRRDSRNGPVLQSPTPVTTVYERPCERVLFWTQRDANPFFHLYESLWMLAGRNDVAGPAKYAKQMTEYSDDGKTFHGAYGYRWRSHFGESVDVESGIGVHTLHRNVDQLSYIIKALKANKDDRRQVLAMWDATKDLGGSGKDLPCNLTCTFQVNPAGALDLTVFNRSNDIVWGCYGANAVHFSVLLEYVAAAVGVPVGRYYQVSVNWHGYLSTIEPIKSLPEHARFGSADPYQEGLCIAIPMMLDNDTRRWDGINNLLLLYADHDQLAGDDVQEAFAVEPFFMIAHRMLLAHQLWRTLPAPDRFNAALDVLGSAPQNVDWIRAGKEWIQRRHVRWANGKEINENLKQA